MRGIICGIFWLGMQLLTAGCVTTGDLRELAASTERNIDARLEVVEDYQAGLITEGEAEDRLKSAERALEAEWGAKIEEIEQRTGEVVRAMGDFPIPSTPLGWMKLLGFMTGGGAYMSHRRDQARLARGEPVGKSPTHPAPSASPPAG